MIKNLRNIAFAGLVLVGVSTMSQRVGARDIWCDDILSIGGEGTCTDMLNTIVDLSWPYNLIWTCEGYCQWLVDTENPNCGDKWGWYGTPPSYCFAHGSSCEDNGPAEWNCNCLCEP
jgi:hypothetical protein